MNSLNSSQTNSLKPEQKKTLEENQLSKSKKANKFFDMREKDQ